MSKCLRPAFIFQFVRKLGPDNRSISRSFCPIRSPFSINVFDFRPFLWFACTLIDSQGLLSTSLFSGVVVDGYIECRFLHLMWRFQISHSIQCLSWCILALQICDVQALASEAHHSPLHIPYMFLIRWTRYRPQSVSFPEPTLPGGCSLPPHHSGLHQRLVARDFLILAGNFNLSSVGDFIISLLPNIFDPRNWRLFQHLLLLFHKLDEFIPDCQHMVFLVTYISA